MFSASFCTSSAHINPPVAAWAQGGGSKPERRKSVRATTYVSASVQRSEWRCERAKNHALTTTCYGGFHVSHCCKMLLPWKYRRALFLHKVRPDNKLVKQPYCRLYHLTDKTLTTYWIVPSGWHSVHTFLSATESYLASTHRGDERRVTRDHSSTWFSVKGHTPWPMEIWTCPESCRFACQKKNTPLWH